MQDPSHSRSEQDMQDPSHSRSEQDMQDPSHSRSEQAIMTVHRLYQAYAENV